MVPQESLSGVGTMINDSTIARIAGILLSGVPNYWFVNRQQYRQQVVEEAVLTARLIAAEVRRTESATTPYVADAVSEKSA
jgi:hypothetical protein